MKKTMIFMAVILLALSIMSGFVCAAYTPVTPSGGISHTMELTKAPYHLDYTITYSFAVSDPVTTIPDGLSAAVSGKPSIASVTYNSADNFETAAGHKITKTAAVNWTGVTFSEPGIYYWKVTKSADKGGAPGNLTNIWPETYLFAFVTDDSGALSVVTGLSTTSALTAKADLQDKYPEIPVNLSVGKTVDGNQGSKNQYFRFDISVTPAGSAERKYEISGFDPADTVNASLYNDGAVQPANSVTMTGGQAAEITVWLKHGQTFKIADLPYGSSYTVTETASGYTAEYKVSGDVTDLTGDNKTSVSDSSLTEDTTVQFTNTKNVTPPTGIDTRSAASVMGLILASALLVLVFVPKRREENN